MKILNKLPHVKVMKDVNISIKSLPLCFNHFIILVQFLKRNIPFEQIPLYLLTWDILFQCSLSGNNVIA